MSIKDIEEELLYTQKESMWWNMKLDLNELDQLQKTIKDLTILKANCPKEDIKHWENLIDYYNSMIYCNIETN